MFMYVLVVEDDGPIARGLSLLLDDYGYRSKVAANGREALTLLERSRPPCLILLDLMMPVMDGEEFLHEKDRHPVFSKIPVCILTAGKVSTARPRGVEAVLAKPIDEKALMAIVGRHCHREVGDEVR
jgi:CheY-like chemotaxis protein